MSVSYYNHQNLQLISLLMHPFTVLFSILGFMATCMHVYIIRKENYKWIDLRKLKWLIPNVKGKKIQDETEVWRGSKPSLSVRSLLLTHIWEKQFQRKKRLFLIHIFRGSGNEPGYSLFCCVAEATYKRGGKACGERGGCLPHGARKQGEDKIQPLRSHLQWLSSFLKLGPTFWSFPT